VTNKGLPSFFSLGQFIDITIKFSVEKLEVITKLVPTEYILHSKQ
jgi:hypothetical protein